MVVGTGGLVVGIPTGGCHDAPLSIKWPDGRTDDDSSRTYGTYTVTLSNATQRLPSIAPPE